ncbi:transformation/transcription domain-associated protein [Nematocida sp. AWRm77]|nr:transformation/transcription domain-associated protein [Nematocida sp. AWRm77]
MKVKEIKDRSIPVEKRAEMFFQWRTTEAFLEYTQNEENIAGVLLPFVEDALRSASAEDKRKGLSVLIRTKIPCAVPGSLVERIVLAIDEGNLTNMSLGVRCLIEITRKTKLSASAVEKTVGAVGRFFQFLNTGLTNETNANEVKKGLLLSSESVVLLHILAQVSKEEMNACAGSLARVLCSFSLFFVQNPDAVPRHLINENIKLQCITTLTQITSLFTLLLKYENAEVQAVSGFIPDLTIFLLGFCSDDAVSIKKDIYHQLSILKSEKKRVFAGYSEIILKDGILLRPRNALLKLLGLTLSTEFLIMFRDSTHRHLSLKVCRESAKILGESHDHTLNKLCANVLVQINDTIIGDNISIAEKGFFVRMNYIAFLSAFRKYAALPITEDTKNVLRSIIRGMKNTMHYFSLFQNIPSNAIVFSLKCFTLGEIAEFSENLGLAFRMFSSFDLEKRADIIIICEFLLIFFYLDTSLFHRVLLENIDLLFELTKKNKAMFGIWRQFLAYAGVARKFSSIVMDALLKSVHEHRNKEFIISGFKEIFASFTVHTSEIESVVSANLQKIFAKCLMLEESLQYTVEIVKELFKAAGKEKLESLHKEMALALPVFFTKIEQIRKTYPHKTDYVELCLTVPVKISVLLPFLGHLAKPLVLALQMKSHLSVLAMETLETCIDNLNADFLLTYLGSDIDAIFVSLIDLVHCEDMSVMAIKLLGKISGKAGNSFYPTGDSTPTTVFLNVQIPGKTDYIELPANHILSAAAEVIEKEPMEVKESTVEMAGYFFSQFFSWGSLSEELIQKWSARLGKIASSDFEELHSIAQNTKFVSEEEGPWAGMPAASADIPCRLVQALFVCASETVSVSPAGFDTDKDKITPIRIDSASASAIFSTDGEESEGNEGDEGNEEEGERDEGEGERNEGNEGNERGGEKEEEPLPVQNAKKLLHTVYLFITVTKVLELANFKEFQKHIRADTGPFIQVLAKAFGNEKTEVIGQEILEKMYNMAVVVCGSKEKATQMTLFHSILHTFCALCYAEESTDKICGIKGLVFITQTLQVEPKWILFQEIRIVRALLASLVSPRYSNVEAVREAIFHTIRTAHNPATEPNPTDSDAFSQLVFCLAQELSHPYSVVRKVCQECLDHIEELFGGDVTSFLAPLKDKVLVQILSKPLRALPVRIQIGNMDAMSYLFGLRPPLLKIDERLERFIGEAFWVISSPGGVLERQASAVKLFVSAAVTPDFLSVQFLMKISQVLIKGIFSKETEIVEMCRDGLRQMYIQGKETPRDMLQRWLLPIMESFGQKKLSLHIIQGLSYLQELDPQLFKHGLSINLLDILGQSLPEENTEKTVDVCFKIFSRSTVPGESEFVTNATVLYVHFFKVMQTQEISSGFQAFLEKKSGGVSVLYKMANEDDIAYYILKKKMQSSPVIQQLGRGFTLGHQSTWRQYVLADLGGHLPIRGEAERALELWRETAADTSFTDLVRKWAFSSVAGMLAYYKAAEYKMLPVKEEKPRDDIDTDGLLASALGTREIFSVSEKVQKRVVSSLLHTLPDASLLCIDGPAEWKIYVSTVLLGMPLSSAAASPSGAGARSRLGSRSGAGSGSGSRSPLFSPSSLLSGAGDAGGEEAPARKKQKKYLREALELPEIEPADAVKIAAYLAEHDSAVAEDMFIPLITAHPEYAESAVSGIVSVLRRSGAAAFASTILSALEDETLYKTHVYIILPVISALPEMFCRTGVEANACIIGQRLFLQGNVRIAVPLFRAAVVWHKKKSIADATASMLLQQYIAYYIHSKGTEPCEEIAEIPFVAEAIPVVPERVCAGAVCRLYAKVSVKNANLITALRPVLRACFAESEQMEEMEKILPKIAEADTECLEEIFAAIPEKTKAPRLALSCAGLLRTKEAVEKALCVIEEALKSKEVFFDTDMLPIGLKLALEHPSPVVLSMVAQMLSQRPEIFQYPEAAECIVAIMQSPDVSSSLKQTLLLSMETEDLQEIRLGLVHSAYLSQHMRQGEGVSGLQPLFIKGLSSPFHKIRTDFFRLFDEKMPGSLGERLAYLCTFDWETFTKGGWMPAFTRMLFSLVEVKELAVERFWFLEDGHEEREERDAKSIKCVSTLVGALKKYSSTPKSTLKHTVSSLLYATEEGSSIILRHLFAAIISKLPEKAKSVVHARAEEMLIRLGTLRMPSISLTAEPVIMGIHTLCRQDAGQCRLLEVARKTGSWTTAARTLEGRREVSAIFAEIGEKDYFLAQQRICALYPETISALAYQQLGHIKTAQDEYEEIQAKAQSGVLLFNEDEYKMWEEQWIECASQLQQWDLLGEIGVATKNPVLTARAKWHTTDFSIESDKALFRSLTEDLPAHEKTFYDLFVIGEKTKETEERLYKIVSSTIEEIARYPKLSLRQISAVEKFQIVVEMNESWQLNESDDLRRDLAGVLLAWKERIPFEWASLSFWSMLVRWRSHVFSSLWNSKTKEKALQYRGYHETAHILNLFSKTLRKHRVYPAALTNLETIYTLPNIEITDAYMKLEEHTKCYKAMDEHTAGLDLLGMTNLNYFSSAQKSGVFLLRGLLLEKKGQHEEAAKVYAQAIQIHPTNAKVWYRWGVLSQASSLANSINAFMQAAAISPGQIARKSIASVVSLMDTEAGNEELTKVFESSIGEIDVWCFVPFISQLVAILSRTKSSLAGSALSKIARVYPQAVYFPIRNALEEEKKKGVEKSPISDMWTFLKTGFTLMCINIESIVECLTLKLRCTSEEEFYRLLCALLSEALQQLFGKEAVEQGSLALALKKISEMIGISSLACKYKSSFDRDFSPALLSEPSSVRTTWEIAQILVKWKSSLEVTLGLSPKTISMETVSRRLLDFEQRNEEIEMFGQYIDIADRAPQMVKIVKFEPEISVVRRLGMSLRELAIRGNNGMVYKMTLQMPSGKTVRREERFIQALALINATMTRSVDLKRRNAKISLKKIVSLNHQTRLIIEEEDNTCLNTILERKLGPQAIHKFFFECRKLSQKTPSVLDPSDVLDSEQRLKMFIQGTETIPDALLLDTFGEKFSSQNDFFYFRKRVAISHSVHCLLAYVFGIGSRMPSRMYVGTCSGSVLSSDFYPSFSEKHALEEVPFRMTPNMQRLIGRAGLEGPFLSTMYHLASLLHHKVYLMKYIDALAREDVGPESAEKSMLVSRSKLNELVMSDDMPAKNIIRLVGNATAPERLSMMDPQWHPWL